MKLKNEILKKYCANLHTQINDLEKEKIILENKFDDSHKSVFKLTKGQENLDKLLGLQCVSFTKEGLGFKSNDKKRSYKNFFIKDTAQKE